MMNEFEDIKIVSMDDAASHRPDPSMAMFNIFLNLSSSAPSEWAKYFNQRWQQHIYMLKRKANVSGRKLEIYCVPEELEKDHIPELNKVISETNNAYRAFHINQIQQEAAQKAQEIAEREQLKSIKNNLKF
ncbi:MAG: hypothetical protein ABIG70_03020 [Pseudomonadota bacterium]